MVSDLKSETARANGAKSRGPGASMTFKTLRELQQGQPAPNRKYQTNPPPLKPMKLEVNQGTCTPSHPPLSPSSDVTHPLRPPNGPMEAAKLH
jgi:hypothetical protein